MTGFVASGLVVLLLGAPIHARQVNADTEDDPVLVSINDEDITRSDLRTHQVAEVRQLGRRPTTNAELGQVIAEVTPRAVATAVDELLMAQRARALGYPFTENLFQQFLMNARGVFRFEGQTKDFDSNEEVLQAIQESEGLTEREVRRMIERQMLSQRTMQLEILDRVRLTEAEAREYYDANIEDYTTPATAALREILIAVPRAARTSADQAAKSEAEGIVARLRKGEDFATLAANVSNSPSSANGGRVGPLLVSEYAEPIQEIIRTLEVGEVADPIRSRQGYQILMLDLRIDAYVRPFDELRDEITNSVFGDRRNAAYNTLLRTLRSEAAIEWHHDELRQIYEHYRAANPDAQAQPIQ